MAALRSLNDTDLSLLVPHFPVLFGALLRVICARSSETAQQAFQVLVVVAHLVAYILTPTQALVSFCARVHLADKKASEKRSGLVYQFVEFVFRPESEHR